MSETDGKEKKKNQKSFVHVFISVEISPSQGIVKIMQEMNRKKMRTHFIVPENNTSTYAQVFKSICNELSPFSCSPMCLSRRGWEKENFTTSQNEIFWKISWFLVCRSDEDDDKIENFTGKTFQHWKRDLLMCKEKLYLFYHRLSLLW